MDFDQSYSLRQYTLGSDGNSLIDLHYDLDANGNIEAIDNSIEPAGAQRFGYDKLDRLITETGLYGDKAYSYDVVGNRTSQNHNEQLQILHYDDASNQLLEKDGLIYQYDSSGNRAGTEQAAPDVYPDKHVGTRLFKYNANQRLDAVYLDGQLQATYDYNALGQRVKKQHYQNGQRTTASVFFYSQSGQLSSEVVLDAEQKPVERIVWVWFHATPLAQITQRLNADDSLTGSQLVYLHADHLNTPRMATDSMGSKVWRWQSDAFGLGSVKEDVDGDLNNTVVNLRFPGQYFDKESGLHYNYFRDYDPSLGRYVQSDPIGLRGGINTYAYVESSPLFSADPFGLISNVTGKWIALPRFNLTKIGVNRVERAPVSWSWWGYLKFLRVYGSVQGYVNVDIKCTRKDAGECESSSPKEWEIHSRLNVTYSGSFDWGPNLYATAIGVRTGIAGGVGANVALGSAAALQLELKLLQKANEKAGPIIQQLLQKGPTGICLLHSFAQ